MENKKIYFFWLELLSKRGKIKEKEYKNFKKVSTQTSLKLQNFISAIYRAKNISKNINISTNINKYQ